MNRDLTPADLLPAIQSVAGALAVEAVIATARAAAAERELAELREMMTTPAPAPAPSAVLSDMLDATNGAAEPARRAGERP